MPGAHGCAGEIRNGYLVIGYLRHVFLYADPAGDGARLIWALLTVGVSSACFLSGFAIVFITVPLFVPIIQELDFDTGWFAVLFIILQVIGLGLVVAYPQIARWLPAGG